MFISEQYGWISEISEEYFNAMLNIGYEHYYLTRHYTLNEYRDVDLMLMGL